MNNLVAQYGKLAIILGGQWGDEGKGKLIDIMAEQYDIVARATGGANAGHTVCIPNPDNPGEVKKFVFHLMLSGILSPNIVGVIGNGVVMHIPTLFQEIEALKKNGISIDNRLLISDRAHIVFEYHKILDELQEEMRGKGKLGTTKRGIGPAYSEKTKRHGIRMHELLEFERFEQRFRENVKMLQDLLHFEYDIEKEIDYYRSILPEIKPFITDTAHYLNKAIKEGKSILLEGANGGLLDIDHGTYPYVTSSNASIGGTVTGTGMPPSKYTSVIGIMKAYCTRVGSGAFPTELENELGDQIRKNGGEFGSTTGRPRRCGWFDAVASQYSAEINGFTSINLTKLDVLDDLETLKIGIAYKHKGKVLESFPASINVLEEVEVEYIEMPGWKEDISGARTMDDLPENARNYIAKIAELLEVPVNSIGVGVSREQMVF